MENNTSNNDVEMSEPVINVKTEYLNVNEDEETEDEGTGDEIDMEDDLERKIEESIASDILLNQPNQSSATWNDNQIPNYKNSHRIDSNRSQPTTSNVVFHENKDTSEEKNKSQATTSNRVFHENDQQFEEKNKPQKSSVNGIFNERKQQYEKENKFSDENHQESDGERKMFKKNYDKQDPDGLEANYLEFAELVEAFKKKEEIRIENEMKEITEKITQNNEEYDGTELLKRIEKLVEEKERSVNQTAIEESEKAEKELENKRNEYLAELFNENFDITKWVNLIVKNIKSDPKPSTSSSFGGQDYRRFANEKKPNLSYDQFINKTKAEPLIKKSHVRHQVDLLVDGNIKKLHNRGAASNIPIKMVTEIQNQKEVICRAVQKYLRPYLDDDTIEEEAFKTISKKLTEDHFERNCFGKKND